MRLRWWFTDEDALPFPYEHAFLSGHYLYPNESQADNVVGEISDRRRFYIGRRLAGIDGGPIRGLPEWFTDGLSGDGLLPCPPREAALMHTSLVARPSAVRLAGVPLVPAGVRLAAGVVSPAPGLVMGGIMSDDGLNGPPQSGVCNDTGGLITPTYFGHRRVNSGLNNWFRWATADGAQYRVWVWQLSGTLSAAGVFQGSCSGLTTLGTTSTFPWNVTVTASGTGAMRLRILNSSAGQAKYAYLVEAL